MYTHAEFHTNLVHLGKRGKIISGIIGLGKGQSYYHELQKIYNGNDFDCAYQRLWKYTLNNTRDDEPLKKDETDDEMLGNSILAEAARLGFRSEVIGRRRDPAIVAAETALNQYAAKRGVEFDNPDAVLRIAEQLRKVDNVPIPNQPLQNLYSGEVKKANTDKRTGRKVWGTCPAPAVPMTRPTSQHCSITDIYVALATFHTFFASPFHERQENVYTGFGSLGANANFFLGKHS